MLTNKSVPDFSSFVPLPAIPILEQWLEGGNLILKITKERTSKLGDYRPLNGGKQHRISINRSLNPYAFLLTLVHEIAHMHIFITYKNRVKPHGAEWKNEFKHLMSAFDLDQVFPRELIPSIEQYMKNPKASSNADVQLSLAFRAYDDKTEGGVVITELELNAVFATRNGRVFIKGPQMRKRFKCKEVKTGRLYLFSPITEVMPL